MRRLNVHWTCVVVKRFDAVKDCGLVFVRCWRFARQPHEHVTVEAFHESFENIEFFLRHAHQFRIGKLAKQNIHFAHATMPRPKQHFTAAGIKVFCGKCWTCQGKLLKCKRPAGQNQRDSDPYIGRRAADVIGVALGVRAIIRVLVRFS